MDVKNNLPYVHPLRTAFERLGRNLIFKRRLPKCFGGAPIFVSPEGGLRFWHLSLERTDPNLLRMVSELVKPRTVVWDIGANIGLFTFAAAGLAGPSGRVIAVEPDTWLVELLRRSSQLVDETCRARIDVLPVAVSDRLGFSEFFIAKRGRSANFLKVGEDGGGGIPQHGGSRERQTVITVTLDWLLNDYPPPQVLKIDVESLELQVLHGASKLIAEFRPIILCEVSQMNEQLVGDLFKAAGYIIYNADIEEKDRKPLDRATWNTVAYPI